MPLHALDGQVAGEAAPTPVLDRVASRELRSRFAHDAVIKPLAPGLQPLQHPYRAIDRGPFLVTRDEETDGTLARHSRIKPGHRRHERRDGALHVGSPAPEEHAVLDARLERIMLPGSLVTGRHDVGMTRKAEIGSAGTQSGIEVLDPRAT